MDINVNQQLQKTSESKKSIVNIEMTDKRYNKDIEYLKGNIRGYDKYF